jgi:hypothetical protein
MSPIPAATPARSAGYSAAAARRRERGRRMSPHYVPVSRSAPVSSGKERTIAARMRDVTRLRATSIQMKKANTPTTPKVSLTETGLRSIAAGIVATAGSDSEAVEALLATGKRSHKP